MHPLSRRGILAACTLVLAAPAWAMKPGEQRDSALRLNTTGTITAVDAAQRSLTLQGPKAEDTFRVDPKVKNLDSLKAGDKVRVDYVVGLAVKLKRGGEEARKQAEAEAAKKPAPKRAGFQYGKSITLVTTIVSLDKSSQMVKLRGPNNGEVEFKVRDKADLAGLQAGDKIVAVVNEAVAVGITPTGP
jgi:Cu/Ag efflux protein CusF